MRQGKKSFHHHVFLTEQSFQSRLHEGGEAESDGVGDHLAQRLDDCRKADKRLLDRLGRGPTEEELAQELGITVEETQSLQKMLREVASMLRLQFLLTSKTQMIL